MLLISKKLNNLSAHPGIEFRALSIRTYRSPFCRVSDHIVIHDIISFIYDAEWRQRLTLCRSFCRTRVMPGTWIKTATIASN